MPYIDIDGLRTYYERSGDRARRAIVMVHGASQDTLSWRYNVEAFAASFDVVAVDLPGHGKSDLVDGSSYESTKRNAAHVLRLVAALGLERPLIMGHSMGGGIACHAAASAPDRIGGIVLVNGTPYRAGATTGYHNTYLVDLASINPTDWFEVNFTTLVGSRTEPGRAREIVREARRCIPEVAASDIRAFAGYQLEEDLPKIACPVLIVETDEDWTVPAEPARQAAARLSCPNEFLLIEGYGHFPHAECPALFNTKVLEAMRRLGLLPANA